MNVIQIYVKIVLKQLENHNNYKHIAKIIIYSSKNIKELLYVLVPFAKDLDSSVCFLYKKVNLYMNILVKSSVKMKHLKEMKYSKKILHFMFSH